SGACEGRTPECCAPMQRFVPAIGDRDPRGSKAPGTPAALPARTPVPPPQGDRAPSAREDRRRSTRPSRRLTFRGTPARPCTAALAGGIAGSPDPVLRYIESSTP